MKRLRAAEGRFINWSVTHGAFGNIVFEVVFNGISVLFLLALIIGLYFFFRWLGLPNEIASILAPGVIIGELIAVLVINRRKEKKS